VIDKIKSHHVERKAILYVRQSSVYQVQNNLESQKLQYAMRDRLCNLGWRDIEVIDEDLGRSASGTVTRVGFERMVAEVCLGHVGAVAAREVSRFARNNQGMAEADRSLSSSGHSTNRSRDGIHPAAKQ
jgi:DNA invertase Pin-like site-specific DNA recombinase